MALSKLFYTKRKIAYCYHSHNVITFSLSQSDHIKRLPLHYKKVLKKIEKQKNTWKGKVEDIFARRVSERLKIYLMEESRKG
jgi:hypothetical protein